MKHWLKVPVAALLLTLFAGTASADRADTLLIGTFRPVLATGFVYKTDPSVIREFTGQRLSGIVIDCYGSNGTAADSTTLDSLAFEVGVLGGSAGGDMIDWDDSDDQAGGWFCTTMDSSAIANGPSGAGLLTPITGAASTLPKYPYDVYSRHVFCKSRKQASGVDIPGRAAMRTDGTASATRRSFVILFNDGFGGRAMAFKRMSVILLMRQPRKVPALIRILAINEPTP